MKIDEKEWRRLIKNKKIDINYIEGANHTYTEKEDILANEIVNFIKIG